MLDDLGCVALDGVTVETAVAHAPLEELAVSADDRDRGLHVVPRHLKDVLAQPIEVALERDVAEDHHTALRPLLRRGQSRRGDVENSPFPGTQLDVEPVDVFARADRFDGWKDRLGDLARRVGPELETLPLERLPQHERRGVEPQEITRGAIQPNDRALRVDDHERVAHAGEGSFEELGMALVLERHLLRRAKVLDRRSGLRRDRAEREQMRRVVRLRAVALGGEDPDHATAGQDRNDRRRLRGDELAGLGPIQEPDGWPFRRPVAHELGRARADDLARESLAERERAALVLHPAIDLTDDLDRLTRIVVEGEHEDGRVHDARALLVQGPEQLDEVARVSGDRS